MEKFGPYELLYEVGDSPTLLIIFSGIGSPKIDGSNISNGSLSWDFKRSSDVPLKPHRVFIRDWNRSWFCDEDGRRDLENNIKTYLLENNISRLVAIGSSMGGFCALALSKLLPIDGCLLFGPQTIINVPMETRWKQLTGRYNFGQCSDVVAGLNSKMRVYSFSGTLDWRDIWQQKRIKLHANSRLMIFPWGEHNVANDLKKSNQLNTIIEKFSESNASLDKYLDSTSFDDRNHNIWLIYSEGWSAFHEKSYGKSKEFFDLAIKLSPTFVHAYYGLSRCLLALGEWEKAKSTVMQGIAHNREFKFLHYVRAYCGLLELLSFQKNIKDDKSRNNIETILNQSMKDIEKFLPD